MGLPDPPYLSMTPMAPAHLHGGDDEAPVHDELTECRRPLVAAPPVHHEQPANVLELRDGEVSCQ